MATVAPFNVKRRHVYHMRDDCGMTGTKDRQEGTGGKRLCNACLKVLIIEWAADPLAG
jgi:hypothetical protein